MDPEDLECYEQVGALRAFVRKPRLLESGNVVQFFVPQDSPDADAALALGMGKYSDAEVLITVHLLKHPDGADARKPPQAADEKPYARCAHRLYQRGFFNAAQVRTALDGKPGDKSNQSTVASYLAEKLGYESMGCVPPAVLLEWATDNEVDWLLPAEYKEGRGFDGPDA